MTGMSDHYQHLCTAIKLSQNPASYSEGEQALSSLKQHDHYPLLLIGATSDDSLCFGDRQMSYILLKQIVREQWDSDGVRPEYKSEIRKSVLDQLPKLAAHKPLLTQCCLLIGCIAEFDLQTHEWPDLLPILLRYTSVPSLAPAAIYCISLLVSDLPQEHIMEISKSLYPVLTEMFSNISNPALLRYHSICIFTALVDSISCAEDDHNALREELSRYVPVWLQEIKSLFSVPADISVLKFALYIESCDLISTLSRSVTYEDRERILQIMSDLLQCILNFASSLLPLYQQQYIDEQFGDDCSPNESVNGVERSSLAQFFTSVADLLSLMAWPISDAPTQFILNNLDEIIKFVVITLQVPFGEEPLFEEDADYLISYTARAASKDLAARLQNLIAFSKSNSHFISLERYSKSFISAESNWRIVEAGLFILGQLTPIPDDSLPFIAELALHSSLHVRIRALWVLKQILVSGDYTDSVFYLIVNALTANVSEECEAVRLTVTDCVAVIPIDKLLSIGDALPYLMQKICSSLRVSKSQDHICIYLNAIQILLGIDQLRQAHLNLVSSALMETWSKHFPDAVVISKLTDTLAVCCVPDTIRHLQISLIPMVTDILKQCDTSAYEGLIDLLSKLVAPCDKVFLSDELSDLAIPLILQVLSNADELNIIVSCVSCLTNFVRNPTDKVVDLLAMIMPAVCDLLQNRTIAVPIGSLIYAIIHVHYARFHEQDVKTLVQLLEDRILASNASFAIVGDSILALSKLIHVFNAANIIRLIIEINGPCVDRLSCLFKKWIELYEDVHSSYLKNISFAALSEIGRLRCPEIDAMIVPGYTIVDTNAPRRTRSQGPATAVIHKHISLPSKIISLLVNELISSSASSEVSSDSEHSQEKSAFDALVSDFLEEIDDDNKNSSDELLLELDPIAQLDMHTFVPHFVREFFSQPDTSRWCFDQLSEHDQTIVQKCLNSLI